MSLTSLTIDWGILTMLTISFLFSGLAGAMGWLQRMGKTGTLRGCAISAANCGVVGLIGCGTVLKGSPTSYLGAFLAGLVAGWTMGRCGMKNWPDWAGRVTLAINALSGKFTDKSDRES